MTTAEHSLAYFGKGLLPQSITTDETGTGPESCFATWEPSPGRS